jgi:hypothetical protein
MPFRREAEIVLAMWRDVERRLAVAEPGSAEEELLQADAAIYRNEYQRLVSEARRLHRDVPPPFPDPKPSEAG